MGRFGKERRARIGRHKPRRKPRGLSQAFDRYARQNPDPESVMLKRRRRPF